MKNINTILFIVSLVFLWGCSGNELKNFSSVEEMVADAKANVTVISAEELKSKLDCNTTFDLIDCREEDAYKVSCIPGAVNIPRGVIENTIGDKVKSRSGEILVYCSNGDNASLVAAMLPKLKFSKVKVLDAGFDGWSEKYPDAIQLEPGGDDVQNKTAAAPSGGCGG